MKKEIDKNLAKICNYTYKKGFKDALYIASKYGFEVAKQNLKNGMDKTRKEWILK